MAVISFHSLEDRMVKEFFAGKARTCTCPPDFPVCVCGGKVDRRDPDPEAGHSRPPGVGGQSPLELGEAPGDEEAVMAAIFMSTWMGAWEGDLTPSAAARRSERRRPLGWPHAWSAATTAAKPLPGCPTRA